jgi:hypothetical protein
MIAIRSMGPSGIVSLHVPLSGSDRALEHRRFGYLTPLGAVSVGARHVNASSLPPSGPLSSTTDLLSALSACVEAELLIGAIEVPPHVVAAGAQAEPDVIDGWGWPFHFPRH